MSRPSAAVVKRLFARSGNLCAFPKCKAPIVVDDTTLGEVCHICGLQPGSARHRKEQTDEERNSYENLILLCPNHHTVVDDDPESYSVERLQKMKQEHESRSAAVPDSDAAKFAENFTQSVVTIGQSGGVSAHTYINVQNTATDHRPLNQRQIEAVEVLWQVLKNLSAEFGTVVFLDTILTQEEIDGHMRGVRRINLVASVEEFRDPMLAMNKIAKAGSAEADKQRPFVSDRLWSTYFVVRAIYGRSALLITNSFKQRALVRWQEDSGCDQLLRAVLPAHVVEAVKRQQFNGLRAAIDALEARFLAEAGMTP